MIPLIDYLLQRLILRALLGELVAQVRHLLPQVARSTTSLFNSFATSPP
jgi:hypothetical protein